MVQIDMEMPENCIDCPLIAEEYTGAGVYECVWLQKRCLQNQRRKDCPLREIKEGQKDKYVTWLEKQIISQTEKSYPEMVLAIYDAGYAYDAIHHLLKLLEESEVECDERRRESADPKRTKREGMVSDA